ncbi:MAG: hypothetical protein M0Z67_10875 [Nitrospiraceae bacterium]|nr:hypothetical protein [Nitrospiraceae bacterium]
MSEWKLVLEEPTAPFQEKLYRKYAANFARVFALLLSALMLAHVFSKSMTSSLARIADLSSNLPEKLSSGSSITWPSSRLTESGRLIVNFQDMSQALALEFEKMKNPGFTAGCTGLDRRGTA